MCYTQADASDPLGATASTSLIVQDRSGSLVVTAVTGAGGEVAGRVDTIGVTEEASQSSSFSSKELATQDMVLPPLPLPPVAVRPSAAASVGGGSSGAGSSAGSTSGEPAIAGGAEKADGKSAAEPSQASAAKQALQRGSSPQVELNAGTESADGSAVLAARSAETFSDESVDGQELLPASAGQAKGTSIDAAAEDELLGSSPDSSSRGGRSASLGAGAWSPQADREGPPGGDRGARGPWRELSGSMGKKAYEELKKRKALAYTQVPILCYTATSCTQCWSLSIMRAD